MLFLFALDDACCVARFVAACHIMGAPETSRVTRGGRRGIPPSRAKLGRGSADLGTPRTGASEGRCLHFPWLECTGVVAAATRRGSNVRCLYYPAAKDRLR